ncbi:MAG: adenylate/guanylate cyclase domain-containing protein [Treponema sp.]|jgi:adenylate cyclase|nr:adenylate/guanylate cyclase domain-containing protein [Treponema sp.]
MMGNPHRLPKNPDAFAAIPQVGVPISLTLIGIITGMTVLSLGLLTAVMSWLVTQDIRSTAENNNRSINQRNTAGVEALLGTLRGDVQMFLYTTENLLAEGVSDAAPLRQAELPGGISHETIRRNLETSFFQQRPDIAAIFLIPREAEKDAAHTGYTAFINHRFLAHHELEPPSIHRFMAAQDGSVIRARSGQGVLQEGGPLFSVPLLGMFFPLTEEAGTRVGAVLFSAEHLTETFGSGANTTFMINHEGAILLHTDHALMKGSATLQNHAFIRYILRTSPYRTRNTYPPYVDEQDGPCFAAFQPVRMGSNFSNATVITVIPEEVVFEGIRRTTWRNIYLSLAVLFLAILFIYCFSKTISSPLQQLSHAAFKIEAGQYDLKLRVRTRDETGVLTGSFISMGQALENFERFTNKAIVAMARKGKLTLGGTTKTGTVCFAFIRDFSKMAEQFDAHETVAFVNAYLKRMVPCISKTRGEVDKFLTQGGVIIMALWGTLESAGPEQDALNSIKAALLMRASLRVLNHKRQHQGKPSIKMGCGINTGELVAGQIGSNDRMEYTVIGDTVNFAARVEGPNDAFDTDILITEDTWNRVGTYLITEEMPGFAVKGKEKPVRVFAVVNMKQGAEAAQENQALLSLMEDLLPADMLLARPCVGPEGPATLGEVRERWIP